MLGCKQPTVLAPQCHNFPLNWHCCSRALRSPKQLAGQGRGACILCKAPTAVVLFLRLRNEGVTETSCAMKKFKLDITACGVCAQNTLNTEITVCRGKKCRLHVVQQHFNSAYPLLSIFYSTTIILSHTFIYFLTLIYF